MTAVVRLLKPCDECGGTGYEPIPDEPEFDVDVECPSCVGGWLPDDETVEAARKAGFYMRDALVAAARYQSEENV